MSANKHQGIRAALCWNPHIAEQARLHNNANVLTMACSPFGMGRSRKNCRTLFLTPNLKEEDTKEG